jgi:lipopolysaccharide export LptBFGC system permease protein LptF
MIQMLFRRSSEFIGVLSLSLLFRLMAYVLPTLLTLTIPMVILTGVLLGIGRLTVDSEIKAFRTHGVHLFPVFLPVLILGGLASVFCLYNSLYLAPSMLGKSFQEIEQLQREVLSSMEPGVFENRLSSQGMDVVLYYEARDPVTGDMRDVYYSVEGTPKGLEGNLAKLRKTTQTGSREMPKTLLLASSGRIVPAPVADSDESDGAQLSDEDTDATNQPQPARPAATLVLTSGTIHFLRDHDDPRYSVMEFDQLSQGLSPTSQNNEKGAAPTLTLSTFRKTIQALEQKHKRTNPGNLDKDGNKFYSKTARQLLAELFQRFSIPLACLSFVLIGLPLSIYIRPSGKAVGVAIAFGLIMVYYVVMHYGAGLTRQTTGIGPEIGPYVIFLPNVVLTFLGGVLLYRAAHR